MQLKGYYNKLEKAIGEIYSYHDKLWKLVTIYKDQLLFKELHTHEYKTEQMVISIWEYNKLNKLIWFKPMVDNE